MTTIIQDSAFLVVWQNDSHLNDNAITSLWFHYENSTDVTVESILVKASVNKNGSEDTGGPVA